MTQKTGALVFNEHTDRYDIRFDVMSNTAPIAESTLPAGKPPSV